MSKGLLFYSGKGIQDIRRTAGTGAAGTVDTHTIFYTDKSVSSFFVRHGSNGLPGPAPDLTAYSTKEQADLLYKPIGWTPDLSAYSTKSQSDSLYLGINSQAYDSARFGGQLPSYYQPAGAYLTAITKAQVEAVLTGAITSHSHNYQTPITLGTTAQYLRGDLSLATFPTSLPANGGTASQLVISYNQASNANYQMLWGSSNYVYGNSNIYCNPYTGSLNATQLQSTIATGTAPLTVNSTTMVSNLNADLLDGQHGSYYAPTTHTHSSLSNSAITPTLDLNNLNVDKSLSYSRMGALSTHAFPRVDDANAVLTIDTYDGSINYFHQIGFSDNGNMYHRKSVGAWNTVWTSGNLTNNNQLSNGAGYITGINSSMVTTALGYTPYNSSNPSGYINSASLNNYYPIKGVTLTQSDVESSTANAGKSIGSYVVQYPGFSGHLMTFDSGGGSTRYFQFLKTGFGNNGDLKFRASTDASLSSAWNTIYHSGNFTPSNYYLATNPNNYIPLTSLSSTATGLTYTNTTGTFSLTSGYSIPTTANQTNWNAAYGWGNHAGLYRPISYVPSWSEITSNPFSFTSLANGQLLKYNSTTSKFENFTPNYEAPLTFGTGLLRTGNAVTNTITQYTDAQARSAQYTANTTTTGLLTSTDWNTFNNKVSFPGFGLTTGKSWGYDSHPTTTAGYGLPNYPSYSGSDFILNNNSYAQSAKGWIDGAFIAGELQAKSLATSGIKTQFKLLNSYSGDYMTIATNDTKTEISHIESSSDASVGFGNMIFSTNAAEGINPTFGGFTFKGPNTTFLRILNNGAATFSSTVNATQFIGSGAGLTGTASSLSVSYASSAGVTNVIAGNETVIHNGIAGGNSAWINWRGSSGAGITQYIFGNGLSNSGYTQVTASQFNGSGVGLTGTAYSLTSGSVYIQYSNDSNYTYQMLWGSGNSVYGTAGIYCNPSTDWLYATEFKLTSDIREKQFIKPMTYRPLNIEWSEFEMKTSPGHKRYGVIAQQLLSVGLNEFVDYNQNIDRYSVGMTDILVQEIFNLRHELNELKSKLN